MRITKYGHCALLIEENGFRILTDPGNLSPRQEEARNVDLILITHEHPDHLHLDSLRAVLAQNPAARIVTNAAVAKLLADAGIAAELLEHGGRQTYGGVLIEGFGEMHGEIYRQIGQVPNTGYRIAERFFYPGDALYEPGVPVEILALPVVGPWLKMRECIEYANVIKPRLAFPVHEGILKNPGFIYTAPAKVLPETGIEFVVPEEGVGFEA